MSYLSTLKNYVKKLLPFKSYKQDLEQFVADVPFEIPQAWADVATKDVMASKERGDEVRALHAPAQAPDFTLQSHRNEPVQLATLLAQGPVVLQFYRGEWCAFCNLHSRALQRSVDEFRALGATLVAVSPQTAEKAAEFADSYPLNYLQLSDPDNQVADKFGLRYKLSYDLSYTMRAFGVGLDQFNGQQKEDSLPIPATYVIAPNGQIVYSFVDADFTKRAEPADVILALRSLKATAA